MAKECRTWLAPSPDWVPGLKETQLSTAAIFQLPDFRHSVEWGRHLTTAPSLPSWGVTRGGGALSSSVQSWLRDSIALWEYRLNPPHFGGSNQKMLNLALKEVKIWVGSLAVIKATRN